MTVPLSAAAPERSIPTHSLPARILGVLRRPTATFTAVMVEPRALGVLTVTTAAAVLAGVLVMRTDVGQQALIDQWERTAIAFGQTVDDARYADLQQLAQRAPAYAVAAALVGGPVVTLLVAIGMFVVLNRGRAARRSFQQVFAVTAHAGVVLAARQLIAAPLTYARESTASVTSLGAMFPMLDEASGPARFLGLLDGFILWWVVLLAIAATVLFGRRRRTMLASFVGIYVGLALVLAGVMALVGDSL